MTTNNNTKKNGSHVIDANPPLPTVALVGIMASVFCYTLPTWESLDEIATAQTFTNRIFPETISLQTLAWIRTIIASFMVLLQVREVFWAPGWEQFTNYLPQSKLQRAVIPMHGIRTMMLFTSWSWNLLALSFGLNATMAHMELRKEDVPIWMLRTAVILFEIAGPMSLLVSMVVRYALWPNLLRNNGDTSQLRQVRTLLWHNANVVLSMSEVGLLGGLPVRYQDFSVAPLFGVLYVLFSWSMMHQWRPDTGPHFLYFFLDTTLGAKKTCTVLLLLLAVLTFFYALFCVSEHVFDQVGMHRSNEAQGMAIHALLILVVCSGVCRFRD